MYLNLAAYLFVDLDQLPERKARIAKAGCRLGLKGTVLLAPEGINLVVSGREADVRAWLAELRADPAFQTVDAKESWSEQIGFQRWKVKTKREIITLGQPQLRPQDRRAATVAPATLNLWLDQGHDDDGRPLRLVDTRNDFEVDAGSFRDAIDLKLASFTDFPAAIDKVRPQLAGFRVVTFCTGGIRCEKAALLMSQRGINNVVQLDGGVLRYFELTDAKFWQGELFVFDQRVGIDRELAPASSAPLSDDVSA